MKSNSASLSNTNGKTFVVSRGDKGIVSSKQQQQQSQTSNIATTSSRLAMTTSTSSTTTTMKAKINQEDSNITREAQDTLSMEKEVTATTIPTIIDNNKNKINNEKRVIE